MTTDQLKTGAFVLTEWLGEGGTPVPQNVADARSKVCLACPKNARASFWHLFTSEVASVIMRWLRWKNQLGLNVQREGELGTCMACGCELRVKIWVPLSFVAAHTTDAELAKLPQPCWIAQELKDSSNFE